MSNKVEIPVSTVDLILARKDINANPSIEIDSAGNIVPRGPNNGADYTVMIRKATNSGNIPRKAKDLKACKDLKGCAFAECAKEVFGKLPKNLEGLCSTGLK